MLPEKEGAPRAWHRGAADTREPITPAVSDVMRPGRGPAVPQENLLDRLAAISKLTERTYVSTLRHFPTRATPPAPADASLLIWAPPSDAELLDATMERISGAAQSIAQEVVTSRLREHPNNKGRAVVGSIFSTSADAHGTERDALARRLQRRPTMEELAQKGIVPAAAKGGVSAALAGPILSLKKQRMADTLDRSLQRRPTMKDLAKRGIIPHAAAGGHIAVSIADKLQTLQRQRTTESLESLLQKRPSVDQLLAQGVMRSLPHYSGSAAPRPSAARPPARLAKRSSSVKDVVQGLEKKRLSGSLERHLQTRPSFDALAYQGIVSSNVAQGLSPALAGSADALARGLKRRPSLAELEERGVAIAQPSRTEKQRAAAAISRRLQKRPSMEELTSRGIIKQTGASAGAAPALASRLHALQKQGTASSLESALAKRPSVDVLASRGILSTQDADDPLNEAPPKGLNRQGSWYPSLGMPTDKDPFAPIPLPRQGSWYPAMPPRERSTAAPGPASPEAKLAPKSKEDYARHQWLRYYLDTQQWSAALDLAVSPEEEAAIVALMGEAPAARTAAATTERARYQAGRDQAVGITPERAEQAFRAVEKGLERRPTLGDLAARGIMPRATAAGFSPSLTSKLVTMEKRMKVDALDRCLQRRPTMEELTEKGIVKSAAKGGVSAALAGPMHTLMKQRMADSLDRSLQRRPTMEELTEKGIVPAEAKGGVSAALAGSMQSLKRQRVADAIDRSLQRRPTMEDLAQKGIVRDPNQHAGPIVEGAKMQLKRRQTSEALRSGLQRRPSMEELRARGILPGAFAAWPTHESQSGAQLEDYLDVDDDEEEYEYEVRGRDDFFDRVEITDLGEDGEEDDDDDDGEEPDDICDDLMNDYDDYEDEFDYDDDFGDDDDEEDTKVDISDLDEWLAAHGGGVAREADVEYDPLLTARDDYTERAEAPPKDDPRPGQPPVVQASGDEDDRPLLGSPTSGSGLRGVQASLDVALNELRGEWDELWRLRTAGALTNAARQRAQSELQRALGGF